MQYQQLTKAVSKSPFLWGGAAALAFYGLIHAGVLDAPLVKRYFTGHPVEYLETIMFMVGMASLLLQLVDLWGQSAGLSKSPLGALPEGQLSPDDCQELATRMERLPLARRDEYYVRRLQAAMRHVASRGTAEGLDNELKYLADLDASRATARYGLFRLIVWAIPIQGFLGTVIGITMALNSLDLRSAENSMMQVLNGLGLKFDTTALALGLSMLLMFVYFLAERMENGLLERVDAQVERDLAGRFLTVSGGGDGQTAAVRHMANAVIHGMEKLVTRQVELWQAALDAAAERWTQMADAAGQHLHATLGKGLSDSLRTHAQQLAAAEQTVAERNRQQWDKLLQSQLQNAQATAALQESLAAQAGVLQQAVAATGEVAQLEDVLNRNLSTLAGAKHFEQTVTSLAAALQLLSVRLGEAPAATTPIKLDSPRRKNNAA